MIARRVYINGEELILLLARPNWAAGYPAVEELCETAIQTTRNGIEHRQPNCDAAVISKFSYTAYVHDEDWQSWRSIQITIGDRRVICPIWPDVLTAANWNTHVHDSPLVVGWNTGMSAVRIASVDHLPDRDYLAPVIIGRLKLNEDEPINGAMSKAKIEVTHDSAFAQALTGEVFTFDGTTDSTSETIKYSMQGNNAFDTTASFKIGEITKGVAISNQTEGITATTTYRVAEITKGVAIADQQESLGLGASFIVKETQS